MKCENEGLENLSQYDRDLLQRTHDDLNEFREQKVQGTLFRSKAKWYNDGQSATKYLCSLEKNKTAAKSMNLLITDSGSEVHDPKQILYHQHQFYKKLYTSEPTEKFIFENTENIKVLPEIKATMEGLFTIDELKAAVKQMSRNKTPGLDGLTAEFYGMFFSKIGVLLLDAVNYAFTNTGVLHNSALRGVINLIPKRNKDIRFVKNLRPISILCCDYKLVEKMLANRIKPALEFIINNDQKGFMADRRISCNIRRILDLVDYAEKNDIPGIIVSIDFLKCFDRIETHALINAMQYFGIGYDFQKWTRIIYTDSVSCVANNGHFSSYFKVTRSVKQGGPCSAYYFLLIAEVLAIELRKNSKIKGILVNDILRILGQYADDIDLYLYGDKKSLNEALTTIDSFCKKTGFRINYDKTTVYRIGSLRFSNAIFYTSKKVCWTNESINVLGVEICHDKTKLNDINYKTLITKSEAILKAWANRGLSLAAKILVVNVLVASLFVYKMSVIPTMHKIYVNKLNEIVTNFLWQGRRPKIPTTDLQMAKSLGGLELVDFELKDDSLKAAWVQLLKSDQLLSVLAYEALCPVLNENIWQCNIKCEEVREYFHCGFWTNVLEAWAKVNFKVPTSKAEVMNQCIWYNSCLKIGGCSFFWPKVYKSGLQKVEQIFNGGQLLDYESARLEFKITVMQWNSLISTIPKTWKELMLQDEIIDSKETSLYEKILHERKPVKWYYRTMLESRRLGRLYDIYTKWTNDNQISFDFDVFSNSFMEIYPITNQLVLRSFQFRMLHKAIVLNDKLFRWKIKETNLCTNCSKHKETIYHFFWDCEYAQKLYKWVKKICIGIDSTREYDMSLDKIILNKMHPNCAHVSNFVLLSAKHYLYVTRCKDEHINERCFTSKIAEFKRMEKYNAIKNNHLSGHLKKWCLMSTENDTIQYNGSGFDNEFIQSYNLQANVNV